MKVAVIMGSKSDLVIVQDTIDVLRNFGIEVVARVLSAHRCPDELVSFIKSIDDSVDVIIGAAGKAAHLPGVIASQTTKPVIGIPIKSSTLDGIDSLLSIVQMPKGIPVATVAIDGALNAGLLAISIMSIKYEVLKDKLSVYRDEMRKKVLEDNEQLVF